MTREEDSKNEKMKKLAKFKTLLEKKIVDMDAELEGLKILLEFVNKTILDKGFKRAEVTKPKFTEVTALPPVMEYKTVVPLKAAAGELLANLYISNDSMRATVAEDKKLNIKTPPFQQFLVERVLSKMQEKDNEAASKGEMAPGKIFSYEIISDGEILRDIMIKNLTEERMRELKSSIHWTLEKMFEKTEKT